LYGIDNDDYSVADLVIDTARYGPEEIADRIGEELEKKRGPRTDDR
jgi:cytidylate kinase